jgi:PAS domain S-box-containing protein
VELDAPESRQEAFFLAERAQRGETFVLERIAATKDGRRIPLEIHVKPFPWQGTCRILSQARDISERKQAEQQAADALAFSQKVLETSPVGIITYKASGQCVSVNPAACRLTGGTAEQLLAQDFRRIELWKRGGLVAAAEEALTSRAKVSKEVRDVSSFGKEMWFEGQVVPLDIEGEPHLLLLIADISGRKGAEEVLRENERRQAEKEKLAAAGRMAARVAHEINNPLAGIQNSFRLIRDAVPAIAHSRNRRAVTAIRGRLQSCLVDLTSAQSKPIPRVGGTDELVSIGTIRTLAACLSELLGLCARSVAEGAACDLCELLDCPQQPVHRQAIVETIEVLKKTKDTFKSKALAELRTKLEQLLGPR